MRLELAGSLLRPGELVLQFAANDSLNIASYIERGYTHFEVICIGGGGGRGGGIDTDGTGTLIRNYGGEGGGGGFHQTRGLLSILPSPVAIVVGAGGALGDDHESDPNLTTDGDDGGYSSFNGTTCRASGGKGGKRAQSNSLTVTTQAHGGEGGIGNSIVAGGGGAGGVAGTPSSTGPGILGISGEDGFLIDDLIIGQGGGGGAGGVGSYDGVTCNAATSGGRGSYHPSDSSAYGLGSTPTDDISSGAVDIVPGIASGAKTTRLNGLATIYGRSGDEGIVVVRFTRE